MSNKPTQKSPISKEEWMKEGERRFGKDPKTWEFVCPACGYIQSWNSIKERIDSGTFNPKRNFPVENGKPQPSWYQECTSPDCNWVAYGLFSGPITVIIDPEKKYNKALKENCAMVFEFAENGGDVNE